MNKTFLMGNLTREPETRYSQGAEPIAVTRYGLAVRKQFKKQGEPDADFFNIVAFGKAGEFAEKYLKKGMQVLISGRLSPNTWEDEAGQKHFSLDIIAETQEFAEKRNSSSNEAQNETPIPYQPTAAQEDDELPF